MGSVADTVMNVEVLAFIGFLLWVFFRKRR